MKIGSLVAAVAIAASPLALPAAALAHAKVIASTPADGAVVAGAGRVTLTFSDALLPPTAAAAIVMTAMPGMPDHGEMAIRNFATTWSHDNRTMTLTLAKPLPKGTYAVRWQGAGAEGHRLKGSVAFTIG